MNNIYNVNCALFGYKTRQKEIAKINTGDELTLKIKQKDNGYKDVFAYNGNDEIGEFFNDESTNLLPFVSSSEKFKVKAVVKKLLSKEENMVSVIVDVSIFSEDDIDPDIYIEDFYGSKPQTKKEAQSNVENNLINSEKEENDTKKREREKRLKKMEEEDKKNAPMYQVGCFIGLIGLIGLFGMLFKILFISNEASVTQNGWFYAFVIMTIIGSIPMFVLQRNAEKHKKDIEQTEEYKKMKEKFGK